MENSYTCVYDAWNRLVKLSDGATTVAEYRYDGLGRRTGRCYFRLVTALKL